WLRTAAYFNSIANRRPLDQYDEPDVEERGGHPSAVFKSAPDTSARPLPISESPSDSVELWLTYFSAITTSETRRTQKVTEETGIRFGWPGARFIGFPAQPEGLQESSRWSQSAETTGKVVRHDRTPKGCQTSEQGSSRQIRH